NPAFAAMTIEQIDRLCDHFERRLKQGERLSADEFLAEQRLAADDDLLIELHKLEIDYRNGQSPSANGNQGAGCQASHATVLFPGIGENSIVGNYKLLQRIGEGGMGVVYMAEQIRPVSRRVALKIVKPGMDSHDVLARFEAERQALALMDHPNIARV